MDALSMIILIGVLMIIVVIAFALRSKVGDMIYMAWLFVSLRMMIQEYQATVITRIS